jgi:hypothetical protein
VLGRGPAAGEYRPAVLPGVELCWAEVQLLVSTGKLTQPLQSIRPHLVVKPHHVARIKIPETVSFLSFPTDI